MSRHTGKTPDTLHWPSQGTSNPLLHRLDELYVTLLATYIPCMYAARASSTLFPAIIVQSRPLQTEQPWRKACNAFLLMPAMRQY